MNWSSATRSSKNINAAPIACMIPILRTKCTSPFSCRHYRGRHHSLLHRDNAAENSETTSVTNSFVKAQADKHPKSKPKGRLTRQVDKGVCQLHSLLQSSTLSILQLLMSFMETGNYQPELPWTLVQAFHSCLRVSPSSSNFHSILREFS